MAGESDCQEGTEEEEGGSGGGGAGSKWTPEFIKNWFSIGRRMTERGNNRKELNLEELVKLRFIMSLEPEAKWLWFWEITLGKQGEDLKEECSNVGQVLCVIGVINEVGWVGVEKREKERKSLVWKGKCVW